MEKAYRHWGDDLGPADTVTSAGLGFAVAWETDFLGRDALRAERTSGGPRRRLRQFAVADGHPLLLHDEPIRRDGEVVGRVTSAARGFRIGRTLCFGYVPSDPEWEAASWDVVVAGTVHELEPLARPPFDPSNERMRVPW